jgi:hypothetical protein
MRVTIEIPPFWVKIVRSPIYFIVSVLTGASIILVPLFLYLSLKGKLPPDSESIVVPLCFAVILYELVFYVALGNAVARELRRDPR